MILRVLILPFRLTGSSRMRLRVMCLSTERFCAAALVRARIWWSLKDTSTTEWMSVLHGPVRADGLADPFRIRSQAADIQTLFMGGFVAYAAFQFKHNEAAHPLPFPLSLLKIEDRLPRSSTSNNHDPEATPTIPTFMRLPWSLGLLTDW